MSQYMSPLFDLNRDSTRNDFQDAAAWIGSGSFTVTIALFAASTSIMMGYDAAIMPSAHQSLRVSTGVSEATLQLNVGLAHLAAIPGALFIGSVADNIGRRHALMYTAMALFVGPFVTALAMGIVSFCIGRLITGFACGATLCVVPLYIAEISPRAHRGTLVTFGELFSNIGVFLGFLIGQIVNNSGLMDDAWRPMIFGGCVPPLLVWPMLPLLPESPRWLAGKGRLFEAVKQMRETFGQEFEAEVEDFEQEWETAPRKLKDVSWRQVLCPARTVQMVLIVGLVFALMQQLSGITAPIYYTSAIFLHAGVTDASHLMLLTLLQGAVRVVATLASALYFDTLGRRRMLIGGALLIAFSYSVMAFSFLLEAPVCLVIGYFIFVASHSATLGPGMWVFLSELFPLVIRCHAIALCVSLAKIVSAAIAAGFIPLTEMLSWEGVFGAFCILNLVSGAFMFLNLPETQGSSLEEIANDLAHVRPFQLSSRKSVYGSP